MKTKTTILALCACAISVASAQTAAPEKSAVKEVPLSEIKADTPVEAQAIKMLKLMHEIPGIMGGVKDDASLEAAQTKFTELGKKITAIGAELKKLPVPDNAARIKLNDKMEKQQKALEGKMMATMMGMQTLAPEMQAKVPALLEKLNPIMQEVGPIMEKYFEPDPAVKKEEAAEKK